MESANTLENYTLRKSNKIAKVVAIIFFITGIGMIVGSFFIRSYFENFYKTAKTTEATIVDITTERVRKSDGYETEHDVFVTYEAEGKEYVSVNLGSYNSSMGIGQTLTIYYQPDNPTNIHTGSSGNIIFGILLGMGILFAIVGGSIFFFGAGKSGKRKKLMSTGKAITAEITGYNHKTNIRINGRWPYCMQCKYTDEITGNIYLFESEYLIIDPTETTDATTVKVYVNPNDYKKYYVDLSSVTTKLVDCR